MTEHDFVLAGCDGEVPEWRLANGVAVDPHGRPGHRVDVECAVGHCDCHRGDLSRLDLDELSFPIANRAVHELELVPANRRDDRTFRARAEDSFTVEHVYFNRR